MNIKNRVALTLFALIALVATAAAQSVPQAFNYQGIARDASGAPLAGQTGTVRLSIVSTGGTTDYSETQNVTTNEFGLFTLQVGRGTAVTGTFAGIQWGTGAKSLKVEVNFTGTYVEVGSSQLLSVPYALVAGATTGAGPGQTLNDLTNVNVPNPSVGQALIWNGTVWVASSVTSELSLPISDTVSTTQLTPIINLRQGGDGAVLRLQQGNPLGTNPAVVIENNGRAAALTATSSNITGSAGVFSINEPTNSNPTIRVETNGTGNAGYFFINNMNSDSAAVRAVTRGTAAGVYGESYGNGLAFGVQGIALGECVASQNGAITCPIGVYGEARRGPAVFGYNTESGAGVQAYSKFGKLFEGRGPTQFTNVMETRFYVDNEGRTYGDSSFNSNSMFASANNSLASVIQTGDTVVAGDIVVITANGTYTRSNTGSMRTVVGVMVANPAFLGGQVLNAAGTPVAGQTHYLATNGIVDIHVSDENGSIVPGDLIVSSTIPGHGMKAPTQVSPGVIIAKALQAFPTGGAGTGTIRAVIMLR